MDRRTLRNGLKTGLVATAPYVLSHHREGDHRCYVLSVRGRRLRLCARCSGVYPGIALGVFAWATSALAPLEFLVVATLPAVGLGHWTYVAATDDPGDNRVRTLSGLCIGVGYGLAVPWFLTTFDLRLVAVGVAYALAAAVALALYADGGWD
jgi:uncharacterized membrane protein